MDLANKTAVITGAAGGIGKAVARELLDAGMDVVLTGRDCDALDALADELGGERIATLAGDVIDPELPERLLTLGLDRFGSADVLVNNAGAMHIGTIEEIDLDRVSSMVRVNVEAVFRTAYVFLRHFKARDSGFLVNVSSIAGLKASPKTGAYAGTKHAVEAFTEALRLELAGTGVRVAAIEPGTVETGLYKDWDAKSRDAIHAGGALAPEDIARCVRFILEQPPHMLVPRLLAVPAAQPV